MLLLLLLVMMPVHEPLTQQFACEAQTAGLLLLLKVSAITATVDSAPTSVANAWINGSARRYGP